VRIEKQERFKKCHEEKFYALIDNPLMGVFILSEKKFENVNDTFAKMFGFKVKDFETMSFDDIIATEPSEPIIDKIRRTLKGIQENVEFEFEALNKETDKNIPLQVYANLISFKGAPALIGNAVNITENGNKPKIFKKKDNTDNISKREMDILKQVCLGLATSEIAAEKNISVRTVDTHRAKLLEKTGCKNTAELILYALRKGIFVVE
jgi:PAS domain S-box-containing protein